MRNIFIVGGLMAASFVIGTMSDLRLGSQLNVTGSNNSLPANLDYASVEEVYDGLKERFDGDLDKEKLMTGLKKGLAEASGDSYTTYWSPEEAELNQSDLQGSFPGIGAELEREGGRPVVVAPIEGTPADKAGIKSKDIIVEVDGQDTAPLTLSEVVSKIRGEKGSTVKLEVFRGSERLSFSIVRDTITVESVKSEIIENGQIGYLRLTQFGEGSYRELRDAAQSQKNQGVQAVILDLRDNPGGSLDISVDIAGLWIKDRPVVEEKRGGKTIDTLRSNVPAVLDGVPTVVLVNEGSASASEIVAGALQDYDIANIIGQTTYGKGSVQELSQLGDGGVLKVTIARWYTPKGKNIDKEGIKPNTDIADDEATPADEQKNKAIELLKAKIGG